MINRHIQNTLQRYRLSFPAVILTGARQTGKTTALKSMEGFDIASYATFDDPENVQTAISDPRFFMAMHPAPYTFDEIQYAPNLFPYIKMAIDSDRHNGMYFMTGSQQFELMKNVSESLAGRIGILSLMGISLREELQETFSLPFIPTKDYIIGRNPARKDIALDLIWKIIHRGAFPELATDKVMPSDFYPSYVKTYIERDVRDLAQVANEMEFLSFLSVAAARTGQLVNYADMASTVGIDPKTAKKWLSILVTSGLVYLLYPYSGNIEKRLVKTPKLYFTDTGLAAYLTKWTNPNVIASGAMAGAFFETYVVMEIVKSFANAGIEAPINFYRDSDGKEIDIILDADGTVYPIEIKATATPSKKDTRNIKAATSIKGKEIAQGVIICNCGKPIALSDDTMAIPYFYI